MKDVGCRSLTATKPCIENTTQQKWGGRFRKTHQARQRQGRPQRPLVVPDVTEEFAFGWSFMRLWSARGLRRPWGFPSS